MKDMTHPVRNISISINKPAHEVYEYAADPVHLPDWVEFIKTVKKLSETLWSAETDLGKLTIEFVPRNEFGIIDHRVTLPDNSTAYNPVRIIENGTGSEVVFTLFWLPGRTEEEFTQDARNVERDLKKMKSILEAR